MTPFTDIWAWICQRERGKTNPSLESFNHESHSFKKKENKLNQTLYSPVFQDNHAVFSSELVCAWDQRPALHNNPHCCRHRAHNWWGEKQNQSCCCCCCWMWSIVAAAFSSSSVRNQLCVAKETRAKLPAMTEQREPFCFIDCSSFGHKKIHTEDSFTLSLLLVWQTGSELPLCVSFFFLFVGLFWVKDVQSCRFFLLSECVWR